MGGRSLLKLKKGALVLYVKPLPHHKIYLGISVFSLKSKQTSE